MYDRFAPYSFKVVREKTKQLGQEYTVRQYTIQVTLFAGFAAIDSYLFFYNLIISIIYACIAVSFVPYVAYLRCKIVYSEYIFLNKCKYILQILLWSLVQLSHL